jgi:hypothetical protein
MLAAGSTCETVTECYTLYMPMAQVEIRCRRLGGGFGGKAANPPRVAAAAAVAAVASGRQARLSRLNRLHVAVHLAWQQIKRCWEYAQYLHAKYRNVAWAFFSGLGADICHASPTWLCRRLACS